VCVCMGMQLTISPPEGHAKVLSRHSPKDTILHDDFPTLCMQDSEQASITSALQSGTAILSLSFFFLFLKAVLFFCLDCRTEILWLCLYAITSTQRAFSLERKRLEYMWSLIDKIILRYVSIFMKTIHGMLPTQDSDLSKIIIEHSRFRQRTTSQGMFPTVLSLGSCHE
jgi:hypothetical protein